MPAAPDVESIVVNVGSGHSRPNRSWILGRLLRDWDYDPTNEQGVYVTVLDAVGRSELVREIYDKYDRPLLPGEAADIELAEAPGKPGPTRRNRDDNTNTAYSWATNYSTGIQTERLLQEWSDQGTVEFFGSTGFVEYSFAGQRLCLDLRAVCNRTSIWCCLRPTEDTR